MKKASPTRNLLTTKRPFICWTATLSVDDIGSALKLVPEDVLSKFRDGRISSWFAEIWGERLFSYKKHANSNYPGSDASLDIGAMGPFEVSVRCLTGTGIKFQKSKNIGSGRHATLDDVYSSVAGVERVVVVDIRQFPRVTFIPLDSKWLLQKIHTGALTQNGLSAKKFYQLLDGDFALEDKPFDLSLALESSAPALGSAIT